MITRPTHTAAVAGKRPEAQDKQKDGAGNVAVSSERPGLHPSARSAVDLNLRRRTQQLLSELSEHIPPTLVSAERQRFIGRRLIAGLPQEDMVTLQTFMNACLLEMRRMNASDIDLGGYGSGGNIWLRIHGKKEPVPDFGRFEPDEFAILIQSLLMEKQREALYEDRNLDFSYVFQHGTEKPYRHRADTYFDMDSLALNMRAIINELRPFDSNEFHPNVKKILSLKHVKEGMILITGITGSGKSTTLDAIVQMNNESVDGHIVIVASPIEYVHDSQRCLIRHREVGRDTRSFHRGTVESLRQDPDIIMVGEMRDPETVMAALEAADSGHKVFSTMHTSSAIESLDRVIGEMPPVEQERVRHRLADVLRCVISQKLADSRDGKRILAKEVLVMTPPAKAAIKTNNTGEIYQMINEGSKHGMNTMEQDLKRLMVAGRISRETAMNYANNKRMMQQLLSS